MHTFCISCAISKAMFQKLMGIPCMEKVTPRIYKTVYYTAKGFTEIALKIYSYKDKATGEMIEKHYLVLRCNLGTIMGESSILALDLGDYTLDRLIAGIQKRIYEINEFRCLNLHKMYFALWRTDRIDLAVDIHVQNPELLVYMLNMSFPYNIYKMRPFVGGKDPVQKTESCYHMNGSRRINIYRKLPELDAHGTAISAGERESLKDLLRVEIQVSKKAIHNMPGLGVDKRNIKNFLNPVFTHDYLESVAKKIFGIQRYVTTSAAMELIQKSSYTPQAKAVLCSIIRLVQKYGSLYELERCIKDVNAFTPAYYGDLAKFRRLAKKIRDLGISPATIPDDKASDTKLELPSLYELLRQTRKKGETTNEITA